MSFRKELEKMVIAVAVDNKLDITNEVLMKAASEVEEAMYAAIDTALSNAMFDSEFRVEVLFYLAGDESGRLHDIEFTSVMEYAEWLDDMDRSIEIFSKKFI